MPVSDRGWTSQHQADPRADIRRQDRQRAAMRPSDVGNDRKSQPGPVGLRGSKRLVEFILDLWRNAWTIVCESRNQFIAVFVALPFYRKIDATSAYEFLEQRFSRKVRMFGSASFTLFHVFRMAIVMSLTGILRPGDLSIIVGAENVHRAKSFPPDDTANIIFHT